MIAELNAIVAAYEEENLSPEFIAEDRDLDLIAVKAALMQSSTKYRRDCGKEDTDSNILDSSIARPMDFRYLLHQPCPGRCAAWHHGIRRRCAGSSTRGYYFLASAVGH